LRNSVRTLLFGLQEINT